MVSFGHLSMGWAGDTWSFVPPIIAFSFARVITLKNIFEEYKKNTFVGGVGRGYLDY